MRIVITAGHGGKDPGAVADYNKDETSTEATFCADMRNYVAYYLRNRGYRVETDGQGPVNAPLSQAVALAENADVAIEFRISTLHSVRIAEVWRILVEQKHKVLYRKSPKQFVMSQTHRCVVMVGETRERRAT